MTEFIGYIAGAIATWVGEAAVSMGFSAATASTLSSVAYYGAYYGITVGVYAGLAVLAAPDIPRSGAGKQAFNQAMPPRRRLINRSRLGGPRMLYEGRKNLYQIQAVAQGPVLRFDEFWFHSDRITVDTDTRKVSPPPGSPPAKYLGNGIWVEERLGAIPETSYAGDGPWNGEGLSDLGGGTIWGADHRGDGIASLLTVCAPVEQADFRKVYPFGHPQVSALPIGAVYDWTQDDTRGGVGDQRLDDPTTWGESWNPVLWLALVECGPWERPDFVARFERKIAPQLAAWTQAAGDCDELLISSSAAERRYDVAGWYMDSNDVADVRARILASCDGFLMEAGNGSLHVQVGKWREPTFVLPRSHIKALRWRRGRLTEEAVNEYKISYLSPMHDWTVVPGDPWRDEADISARGVKTMDFIAEWVPSHRQCRRLCKIAMGRSRAAARGTIRATLHAMSLFYAAPSEGGVANRRWFSFEREKADGSIVLETVELTASPRIDFRSLTVELEVCSVDPTAYDGLTEEEEGTEPSPDLEHDPGDTRPSPDLDNLVITSTFDDILI